MVKNHNVREVIEDVVIGTNCHKHEKEFRDGYDSFQFPLTVSFDAEGEYTVVIKGKKAVVEKIG